MSNAKLETIADIVSEMRISDLCASDTAARSMYINDFLDSYADRIEAAWKRERDAGAEAAKICGEIGEMIGREAAWKHSVKNCNRFGNAARMREALENIAEYAKAAACHTEDAHLLGYINQISMWAEDAISAPPRNCYRFSNANEALEAFANEKGETLIEFVRWLFAETKGAAK